MKSSRKRYRIKSKFRFITFMIIVIGLFVGAFGFISGTVESTASTTEDYITYTVEPGDTLWDIATDLKSPDADTRMIVHAICKINDISADQLQPGMTLTIPTR